MSRINDIWQRKPAGLVLGLDFSGGRVTTPDGKTGTLNNGASISGRTLLLNGVNSFLEVADSADLSFTNGSGQDLPFSFSGWYYITSTALDGQMMACKLRDSAPAAYEWYIRVANSSGASGKAQFVLLSSTASAYLARASSVNVAVNTWTHLAISYSGSETVSGMKLFLNGVEDTSSTTSTGGTYTGMSDTNATVRFGLRTTNEPVAGSLASLLLFARELTQPEIAQIYNAGAARIAQGGTP